MDDVFADGLVRALADTADPDQALLGLVRLLEAVHREQSTSERRGQDRPRPVAGRAARAGAQPAAGLRDRLLAVLGASPALGDHLVRHPDHWVALTEPEPRLPEELRDDLWAPWAPTRATPTRRDGRPDGGVAGATDALRRGLPPPPARPGRPRPAPAPTPADVVDRVGRELADLAAAALEAALAIARAEEPDARRRVPARGDRHGQVRRARAQLRQRRRRHLRRRAARPRASTRTGRAGTAHPAGDRDDRACSAATAEGTLWPVDAGAAARGQGRAAGAHPGQPRRVLRAVGQTWEFQALLKARPWRATATLGERYVERDRADGLGGGRAGRTSSPDVQAMRRRVEENVPARRGRPPAQARPRRPARRRVQRAAAAARARPHRRDAAQPATPCDALARWPTGGYVGARRRAGAGRGVPVPARRWSTGIQLHRLRRTHLHARRRGRPAPARPAPLRLPAPTRRTRCRRQWQRHAREVRRLHERLFYRPLLAAVARLARARPG